MPVLNKPTPAPIAAAEVVLAGGRAIAAAVVAEWCPVRLQPGGCKLDAACSTVPCARTAAKAAECKAGNWLLTSRPLHSAALAGRAGQWGAW